jgi:guanylate kinase
VASEKRKTTSNSHSLLIVISGPSGVGKDATLTTIKKAGLPYHHVLTATTRPKRSGEQDGVDYWFISQQKFQDMVKKNQLLEWAKVYGNYYGVPKKQIVQALKQGKDVIVKVDVQGAETIKRIMPDALLIFLMPPSFEELANRLKQRYGMSSTELDIRLGKAREEMERVPIFDCVITSYTDNLDLTMAEINTAVATEKNQMKPRTIGT